MIDEYYFVMDMKPPGNKWPYVIGTGGAIVLVALLIGGRVKWTMPMLFTMVLVGCMGVWCMGLM